MATKQLSRRHKALTLVPLALLSGAWTASLAGLGPATAVSDKSGGHGTLPDGTKVPSQAIEAPANVPVAGVIAPGVPSGTADQVVDNASTSGIPSSALSAYQRAAQIIDAADTSCNVPWELVAAIGRVESDHGRYSGNVLSSDGVSKPGIYGPELNGKDGTQAIQDTDGGQLDKDPVFDKAVGPMQFIPSTWQVVKVDADGDGQRNPQDIDDASLATSVYLCSGTEDLGGRTGQEAAVYRYNHSQEYVDLVLRIMAAYQSGDYTAVPDSASGGNLYSLSDTTAMNQVRGKAKAKQHKTHLVKAQQAAGGGVPGTSGGTGTLPGTSGTTSTGGTGGVPKLPKPPVPVPTQVAEPVLSLAQATAFCTSQLPALIKAGVPGAVSTCAGQIAGKTQAGANSAIGGIIAALQAKLPKLPGL